MISEIYNKMEKPDGVLSHVFVMLPSEFNPEKETLEDFPMQFGFYDKEKHLILTIKYVGGECESAGEEAPVSQEEIKPIDIENVKIDASDCFSKIADLIKEKYKGNVPLNTIVILQEFQGKTVWNITILRSDFKTLNVKIDAESGEVIEDSLKGLIHVDK